VLGLGLVMTVHILTDQISTGNRVYQTGPHKGALHSAVSYPHP